MLIKFFYTFNVSEMDILIIRPKYLDIIITFIYYSFI